MKTKLTHPNQEEHDSAVLQLVDLIGLRVSSEINYDHVESVWPKNDIDLVLDKHRYDIAWRTPAGDTILLEVRVRKRKNSQKSSK